MIILLHTAAWLLAIFPHAWRLTLGHFLGHSLAKLSPRRKRIATTNLELCFPTLSSETRQKMLDEHISSVGQGMIEALIAWCLPTKYISKRLDVEGREHFEEVYQSSQRNNRPILLLGLHSTSIELTPPFLNTIMTASGVYKPLRNAKLNKFVLVSRQRHAENMFSQQDMRKMLAHLQQGKHLWYASDQDFGLVANGKYANFFGYPAHTLTLFAKMAKRTNAIVLPVGVFRNGHRYVMRFSLPLTESQYHNEEVAAQTANQIIESLCQGYESQYYWVHRRFKTQADGRNVYDKTN